MKTGTLIADLMQSSGVSFGTSGARGLATAMTDRVCYLYTCAFLQHLARQHGLNQGSVVAVSGDFRSSTPRIMQAVAMAVLDSGYQVVNSGYIPTPAIALYGLRHAVPTVMVTGSHIPDDRNGLKFYRADGEILKEDELGITACRINEPGGLFHDDGSACTVSALPPIQDDARLQYIQRYLDFFPENCLSGKHIGVYQHSTVGRDIYCDILTGLGAKVLPLGRSNHFIPVDTEAIREEDIQLARQWAKEYPLDAIISADGDGDRPLISDERGNWLRGDVAGILCARYLQADSVVTPVSSNTALEKSKEFSNIYRTRIGSPYVIAAMQSAAKESAGNVIGYEANGGFLTANIIKQEGRSLAALPTRDAIIVPLAILMLTKKAPISSLLQQLPPRFTSSGRLKDFPTACSQQHLSKLIDGGPKAATAWLSPTFAAVKSIDTTDGLRMTLENEEIIHLRPSGNAPELRCYNEADSHERAEAMNRECLAMLAAWR